METTESRARSTKKGLREGFTTGSAAAAAAKAATLKLCGVEVPEHMDIPLPGPGSGRLSIPIATLHYKDDGFQAAVVKDGGDDPDVTHGAHIEAWVGWAPDSEVVKITLEGGKGVGRVTLPGLPVAVGEPAINPGPREQILHAVREALADVGRSAAVRVVVSVPRGEELAAKTMNPRLGIEGGISILGTRGTVKPYSHESWQATVRQSMSVARAAGLDTICLATGRRSERLLMALESGQDPKSFVQAADYYAFALQQAKDQGFSHIIYGCFFGKLVKMAQGFTDTHVRAGHIDFAVLARWCNEQGSPGDVVRAVAKANTAMQVQDMLLQRPEAPAVFRHVLSKASEAARAMLDSKPKVEHVLFHMDGTLLARNTQAQHAQ
ncbi:MAG: cobalt-precorrin-5B (C(1))-methyltransferase [Desulfovibrio sp.]|nr:MAG: cobalt-precorrin-5B (C(1))-methyltransferase [Desulfovibrio sp.]